MDIQKINLDMNETEITEFSMPMWTDVNYRNILIQCALKNI